MRGNFRYIFSEVQLCVLFNYQKFKIITILLTLFVFWFDSLPMAIFLCIFNLFLESVCGILIYFFIKIFLFLCLNLLQQIPPGDGVMPTIGTVYCWNLMLTLFALCLHCILHFLITILLPDTKCLPEQVFFLYFRYIIYLFFSKKIFLILNLSFFIGPQQGRILESTPWIRL